MKKIKYFTNGILDENPIFRLVLGTCPTLAITTAAMNGIAMGAATTFVLICSNLVISLLRNVIPDNVRIPAFVVIIASFVTIVDMVMHAFMPAMYDTLGIFIPLIVVNCIIMGRAEGFAYSHGPIDSILDGAGMGVGFTLADTFIAAVRELIGAGSIFGIHLMPAGYQPALIFILAPGAFLTYGTLMAILNQVGISRKRAKAKAAAEKVAASEEVVAE
ncbi:electron transport complex subunit RsxE [uncultured Pseudoramibacter sp.]|jgi:electron transport complex protein RnfE|uniref:Ion-translocating oxidoreductase complex subunit E n=1 Tax=Candidatus Pseudoramibacter fermentans TaxID=2594427 RepID=A0A6L5GRT5_9FIRM|nr:electron transport complex subunit E [uncultured Pseudoramibacter sp.]MQM72991.1 electron transport complex subunit E [Candidatus Pseudoramibacter fermentans]RRF93666.1 MAG: electron transport complex subunit E [Eubacteriaceae bacterium]